QHRRLGGEEEKQKAEGRSQKQILIRRSAERESLRSSAKVLERAWGWGPGRAGSKMCGIIGHIGPKPVVPVLIDGLRRLEYRGYDSAGVAVVHNGAVELRRSAGKLSRLEDVISLNPLSGEYGVGHTR